MQLIPLYVSFPITHYSSFYRKKHLKELVLPHLQRISKEETQMQILLGEKGQIITIMKMLKMKVKRKRKRKMMMTIIKFIINQIRVAIVPQTLQTVIQVLLILLVLLFISNLTHPASRSDSSSDKKLSDLQGST